MRQFDIVWENDHSYGQPNPRLPTMILAERYEVVQNDHGYTRVEFYGGDEIVATLFQLPTMIRIVEPTE